MTTRQEHIDLLLDAAREGDIDHFTPILLANDAVINGKKEEHGRTALMFAARQGHIAIVQLLLDHHANVDLQTNNGSTALMVAAQEDHIAIVQLLLEHHADIALKSNRGNTALMIAVENDKLGAARVLMEHKALLLSDNAALAEYRTKYIDHPPIFILVKQEHNWRRRKPWLLFWLALRRSTAAARPGTRARKKEGNLVRLVLSFDFVGRKVASYL